MAKSPTHKFGQVIGELLEAGIHAHLKNIADGHGLYLDKKGKRPARRTKNVTWADSYGNTHDLDFVLERGGTPKKIGTPVAFIESAWRRYTRHSKNKAQEIQGAVKPLYDVYSTCSPFLGAILAGDFTPQSLAQLKTQGFKILYFTYSDVKEAFKQVEIDIHWEENTPDVELRKKLRKWNALSKSKKNDVMRYLFEKNKSKVDEFIGDLTLCIKRQVSKIVILPLHGKACECQSAVDALEFINAYNEEETSGPIVKYEVVLYFDNNDKITGEFAAKQSLVDFLKGFAPVTIRPIEK